jgi:acetyl-CoA carboxylase biotin carboxyl carrier protein
MDIREIKEVVELVEKHDISKLEVKKLGFRLTISRGAESVQVVSSLPAAVPAPVAAAPAPVAEAPASATEAAPAPAAEQEDAGTNEIKAPIVGTFYRSSSPEADAFVKVGDTVEEDTIVCIVEAMKVMNEIKAETKGVITKILVENATPVMFGQPLFKVKPA